MSSLKGSNWDKKTLRPPIRIQDIIKDVLWHLKTYIKYELPLHIIIAFTVLRGIQIMAYSEGWKIGEKLGSNNLVSKTTFKGQFST